MGDTNEIGTKLNLQHKPQMEWSILIITALIAIIGAIVMFSSRNFTNGQAINFSRYIVIVTVGIGTMIALYYFDYTKLLKLAIPCYILGILLLVVTLLIGIQINGAKTYLSMGFINISSTELASLLFLIAFVGFLESSKGKGIINILILIGLGAFSTLLLLLLPSISTVFIMIITYFILLVTSLLRDHFVGNKKKQLISFFTVCIISMIPFIFSILMNFGLFPSMGINMPFVSYGGTGYVINMAFVGIILSVWRRNNLMSCKDNITNPRKENS